MALLHKKFRKTQLVNLQVIPLIEILSVATALGGRKFKSCRPEGFGKESKNLTRIDPVEQVNRIFGSSWHQPP